MREEAEVDAQKVAVRVKLSCLFSLEIVQLLFTVGLPGFVV